MSEIHQLKLAPMFSDPVALYEKLMGRRGYIQKPGVTEFDAELETTWWTSMGCAICCVLVHHEQKGYIVMLDSVDITAMQSSLTQIQIALNANSLMSARRPIFGHGLL